MIDSKRASFALGAILGLAFFELVIVLLATPATEELLPLVGAPLLTIFAALGFRAWIPRGIRLHALVAWIACAVLALACVALHLWWAPTVPSWIVGALASLALGGALAGLETNLGSDADRLSAWQGSTFGLVAAWPVEEVAWRALGSYVAGPVVVFAGLLLSVGLLPGSAITASQATDVNGRRRLPLAAIGIGMGLAALFGAATHYGREVCHSIYFDRVHCSILTAFGIGVLASTWRADRLRGDRSAELATRLGTVSIVIAGLLMSFAERFAIAAHAIGADWMSSWRNDIVRGFLVFGVPSAALGFVCGLRRWRTAPRAAEPSESESGGLVDDWIALVASTWIFVLPLSTLGRLDIVIPTLLLCVVFHKLERVRPSPSRTPLAG